MGIPDRYLNLRTGPCPRADRRAGRLRVLSRHLEPTTGARTEREQAEAARTALSRYGEALELLVE